MAAVVLGLRIEPRPVYIAAVAAMLVSAALVSRASGLHLRRLTVPAVWYLSYIAGTAVPALFVAAEERSQYVAPFLLAVVATLFTAPVLARALGVVGRGEVVERLVAQRVEGAA